MSDKDYVATIKTYEDVFLTAKNKKEAIERLKNGEWEMSGNGDWFPIVSSVKESE